MVVRAASQNPWIQQEAAACPDRLCGAPRPGIGTWGLLCRHSLGHHAHHCPHFTDEETETQRGYSSPILDGRLGSRAPPLFLPGHPGRLLGK